ncbi:hypothetical protein KR059_012080 [Drosophila kikkawai]|nr:hypothetical protein KR059_012080 [Drosophila kikkawai]
MCDIISKTTNIVCQTNDKFVKDTKCFVKAVSWEKSTVQMTCFLIKPMKNPTIYMQAFMKDYSNQYQPFLLNISFSLCDVLSRRKFLHYTNAVREILAKYTNVNHSCPFVGHTFAHDFNLDPVIFPPTLPLGSYLITIIFMENFPNDVKEIFGTIKLYFDIMQKGGRRWRRKDKKTNRFANQMF